MINLDILNLETVILIKEDLFHTLKLQLRYFLEKW